MSGLVFAVDLGGSRLKTGLVGRRGEVVAEANADAPVPLGPDGRSEVDLQLWWDGLLGAAQRLSGHERAGEVAAVAITGLTRTQVLLDAEGRPVRPAITWRDTRASPVPGAVEPTDPFHPLARLGWIAEHEPDALARTVAVVDPKDALAAALTGRIASDRVALARLIASTAGGTGTHFAPLLPSFLEPGDIIGRVRGGIPGWPEAWSGLPVVMASHDTWTAVLGLGALRPGEAYALSGTSDVAGLLASHPATAEGLMAVPWGPSLHHLGGPSQNGADVVPWFERLSGTAIATALAGARQARPLLFLPFLNGERVPHWDPDLRGAFLGLDRAHGPADLAWAVIEGAAFALRDVIERAETATGLRASTVRLAGGATRLAAWTQVRADVLGRPMLVTDTEPGLVGCAMVAAVALGWEPDLAAAQGAMTGLLRRIDPDPAYRDTYAQLVPIYRAAIGVAAHSAHALARIHFPDRGSAG